MFYKPLRCTGLRELPVGNAFLLPECREPETKAGESIEEVALGGVRDAICVMDQVERDETCEVDAGVSEIEKVVKFEKIRVDTHRENSCSRNRVDQKENEVIAEERIECESESEQQECNDPVIFERGEYQHRLHHYNPGVAEIPRVFPMSDPAELETPLRELMHADDAWTFVPEKKGKTWELPSVKTELGAEVERVICAHNLQGGRSAYVRDCMMTSTGELLSRLDDANKLLDRDGPSYMQQQNIAKDLVRRSGEISAKRGDGVASRGRKIPLGDLEVQEITLGKLHFRAIDFGDTIRLSERSKSVVCHIESQEKNQCVLLHMVAGTQWSREGGKWSADHG